MAAITAAGEASGGSTAGQRMAGDRELEMEILRMRVELLDRENQMLRTRMASCRRCSKFCVRASGAFQEDDNSSKSVVGQIAESSMDFIASVKEEVPPINSACNEPNECTKPELMEKSTSCLLRTIHDHPRRYVALKLMYFGQRFYGFASEAQQEPTVESEIFKALGKTKLSTGKREDLCYSRCGRTDKGVSSTGQVVSLFLRSKLKDSINIISKEEEEIDYVRVLNRALPNDIRVIGWSAASTHFHARFSCLSREYKYFFWRGSLDVMEMKYAAKKFIGIHDFRNFCKMDAVNVKNYTRQIISFEITPCYERSGDDELWAMTIKGSAFLWHQVRFMVAVLFLIGEGHESPSVIDSLLDTNKVPRKPQYNMAPELPLVLRSCEFDDIKFTCSPGAQQALRHHLRKTRHDYLLQAAIFQEALDCLSGPGENDRPLGDDPKKPSHAPLLTRQTEPSYEERRARLDCKSKTSAQAP